MHRMIEIIKRGTKQKIKCKNCGCFFSYEQEDVQVDNDELRSKHFISCPQCKEKLIIDKIAKAEQLEEALNGRR